MKPGDLLAAKYRLVRIIGAGAMGQVWAAVNESTRRPVALKLLEDPSPELRRRLFREARAGGSLKHPNVVDVYDVGETERGGPFLVMELLSGETLAERLEHVGRLPPGDAVAIALGVARALRAAHGKGIVHRDLKPANLFLHREADVDGDIVKVLDFGVSKAPSDMIGTLAGTLMGTPAYMSPEQARAEMSVDARTDLWSLGVVLFEMLAGRRPFPNSSPYGVIAEVLTAPIPSIATLVPEVSPGLVHVVERCLTRDVSVRVASADEVVGLLRPLQDQGAGGDTSVRSIADDLSSFDDAARVAPSDPPPRPPLPSEPTLPRFQPAPMAPDASLSRPRLGGAAPLRLGMPRPGLLHVVPGSRMAVPLRLGVPRPALSVPPSASPPLSPDAAEDGQATPVASARRP